MDSIFPILVLCILPIFGLAGAFALGRWSAQNTISVHPREQQPATASPFYQKYQQEK